MDEALSLPTEHAALLALRTQQVIAHESSVCDTVDPLAGSYYIEALTDDIEKRARDYISKIDDLGGAVRAIETGFQQREIHDSAYAWQRRVEKGDAVVVGVNRFVEQEESKPELLRIDESLQQKRSEKLKALRARRDSAAVEKALSDIGSAASGDANLMPPILAAVESHATLGEISDALRAVFGVYRENFSF
jgi:methylmalonyl-CoA mutase N-terminal domain/subunit